MESGDIIALFFGCASLIFSVATFLWGVYMYLRQKGYYCIGWRKCTYCLQPCFGVPCRAPRHCSCGEHYFNTSHLSSHHVKETWV